MPENNDPMMLTLDALRSDAERTPLADSLTVRRRGDRRTRNQAVGGALAAVVVVAAVVGVSGSLLGGSQGASGPPASSSTPSPSTRQLAADPLLQPADIGTVGHYSGWQLSPDAVDESARPLQCMTSPTGWASADGAAALYYGDLDGRVIEHVLRFPDETSARNAVQVPLRDFRTCPDGPASAATVTKRPDEQIPATGDEAYRGSRTATPKTAGEVSYYELAVARTANVVVVLEWTSMGNPNDGDAARWVWTPQRVHTALDRAVG
jgi:hypothetical protein